MAAYYIHVYVFHTGRFPALGCASLMVDYIPKASNIVIEMPWMCIDVIIIILLLILEVFERKSKHKAAYRKVIRQHSIVHIRPVRFNHMGLPRSGKSSFCRRLTGLILNLMKAKQAGEKVQRSTGVAEEGGQVIIRDMSTNIGTIQCKAWSLLKDLLEEANMLSQFFYQIASSVDSSDEEANEQVEGDEASNTATSEASKGAKIKISKIRKFFNLLQKKLGKRKSKSTEDPSSESPIAAEGEDEAPKDRDQSKVDENDIDEMFSIIGEAMEEDQWDAVQYLLEDIILLIHTDTGGQAEFMDLHASLACARSFLQPPVQPTGGPSGQPVQGLLHQREGLVH